MQSAKKRSNLVNNSFMGKRILTETEDCLIVKDPANNPYMKQPPNNININIA